MKIKPILFRGDMVRQLLVGKKTQTRRYVKRPGEYWHYSGKEAPTDVKCPYGKPGDLLYVRESLQKAKEWGGIGYSADETWLPNSAWEWKKDTLSPRYMPRRLSRITLEIIDVRVQRLGDIKYEDILAEGTPAVLIKKAKRVYASGDNCMPSPWMMAFQVLWQSVHGRYSWGGGSAWVWVITFKVHRENIDQLIKKEEL